jgi:hypothetical protein
MQPAPRTSAGPRAEALAGGHGRRGDIMTDSHAGTTFEIVGREDYSDVTFLLEVAHPQMARAAR